MVGLEGERGWAGAVAEGCPCEGTALNKHNLLSYMIAFIPQPAASLPSPLLRLPLRLSLL